MKKKALSLLLALVMCLGLLPTPALADKAYPSDITISYDSQNTVTISIADQTTPLSGEGWRYEPASKTLILDGFEGRSISFYEGEEIVDNITLELRGTNTLSESLRFSSAWSGSDSTATIIGSGSILASYVSCGMDIAMKSGTVTTSGKSEFGVKLFGRNFHMTGGTLNAVGRNYGIYGEYNTYQAKNIVLESGTVTAYGDYAAIWLQRRKAESDSEPTPGTDILNFGGRTAIGGEQEADQQALSAKEVQKVVPRYADTQCITALTAGELTPGTETEEGWREWIGAAKYAYIFGGEQADPPSTTTQPIFNDVPAGEWYADPVVWAVEKGITNGTGANTFSPYQNCSHAQILTFLWRAAGEPKSSANSPISLAGNEYYADAVRWATEKGIIDKTFDPNADCTRSDAVSYIWQAFGSPSAAISSFTDVPSSAS